MVSAVSRPITMTTISHITFSELIEALPNGADSAAAQKLRTAYEFAAQAHGNHHRESGERYIEHDLGVACIVQQLGIDHVALVASLLHDVLLPHTGVTKGMLESKFGKEVTTLVTGVSALKNYARISDVQQKSGGNGSKQALEGIRRAVISIIEGDIRIILIRMADCLQELRKASQLDKERQHVIASEAMNIYAPLANRLGVWQLKWELEDLAFRYLEPRAYREIAGQLAERRTERARRVASAQEQLQEKLKEMGLKGEVTGRPKHIYSIYRKMQRKNLDFEEIYDIHALRVILFPQDQEKYARMSTKEKDEWDRSQCFLVLGAVHSLWQPVPKEFDDYIAMPKANGYKSLHTAVIDTDSGQKLEVQIRTARMHEEAEKGVAAHWAYKEEGAYVSASVQRRIQGLRELLNTLQEADPDISGDELLETELMAERIYVFTPRNDVIDLPVGSTPIDFAYQIHTQVGHRCRGARVNGKMVSLDYKLKSGDRVEIITAKRGGPSRDWMNASLGYTGSARTRSKVRHWFRKQERGKNIQQGREVVERELKRLGLSDTYTVSQIAKALKYDDEKEFLAKVGFGDIQSAQISGAIALMEQNLKSDDEELRPLLTPQTSKPKGLTVLGTSGLATKMAGCCNPIPPEPIVGYITRGHGITIHRQDCKQLEAITERERIIKEVDWGMETETFPIPIVVKAYRRPNLIDEMSAVLRGQQISAPRTKTITSGSMVTVYLVLEVTSLQQLNWLLKKFESLNNVIEVRRQRWS